MSKAKARVFVPLTKVDETQRLVYGRITQEMLDKSKEVMDYDSSKPLFKQWSDELFENSGGLSKGNVRVMHGLTAAGKLTELDFNDAEKAIDVCAKVVDDTEWEKVVEGVYTGFSVGGSYEKRWTDTVDGEKVKKFTARPNEVSLVDNPCVPSATFSMMKADGSAAAIPFKVDNDDEEWPDFRKVEENTPTAEQVVEEAEKEEPEQLELDLPTNDEVVEKATQMAKAADEATKTWMDFVTQARDELMKAVADKKGKKKDDTAEADDDSKDGETDSDDDDSTANKVTSAGVKQVWTASDGKAFEKKADAQTHELTLIKTELTEAEKLKIRLEKALSPEAEANEVSVFEDFDRLGKVVQILETPFEPEKLAKGMYTVSRFANTLWDMGSLTRSIKAEGKREGDDASDDAVSSEMQKALSIFAGSFTTYVSNQVDELLAGIDDELCVATYDYYYAAAKADPENQLAKDVCSVISDRRDPSRELRETLSKSFGYVEDSLKSSEDDMSPSLKKRFDKLETENTELKKIAEDAVAAVETLTKRVEEIADQPLPRAPRQPALLPGDMGSFFGKANTEEARIEMLKTMLENEGPEALSVRMIKASHASGGQPLHLNR